MILAFTAGQAYGSTPTSLADNCRLEAEVHDVDKKQNLEYNDEGTAWPMRPARCQQQNAVACRPVDELIVNWAWMVAVVVVDWCFSNTREVPHFDVDVIQAFQRGYSSLSLSHPL